MDYQRDHRIDGLSPTAARPGEATAVGVVESGPAPVRVGALELPTPFVIAPMAGMTDTAFRRMVKAQGGCGLVVSEMVSSEGLVRGIDRTLEYADFTEAERPVSIQIFGGDPDKMAEAARIVESLGADIVDVNMGCPVPKIAKHHAGCSLMRQPEHAASVIAAMAKAVKIPVTVKMRAGWNEGQRNAPELAKMVEDAGAAAVAVHGRTAAQSYTGHADWDLVAEIANTLTIPVFGSGDCVEPEQVVERMRMGVEGVLVGRGVLRNPWILAQAADLMAGRPKRQVSNRERGQFLLDYIDQLCLDRIAEPAGFHTLVKRVEAGWSASVPTPPVAGTGSSGVEAGWSASDSIPPANPPSATPPDPRHDRWVVNKIRALAGYYTKGIEGGAALRAEINRATTLGNLRTLIGTFFL